MLFPNPLALVIPENVNNTLHIRLSLKWRLLLPPRLNIPQTKKPQILFIFIFAVYRETTRTRTFLAFPRRGHVSHDLHPLNLPPHGRTDGRTDGRRCDGDAAWWRHKHLAAAARPMTIYTVFISRPSGDWP